MRARTGGRSVDGPTSFPDDAGPCPGAARVPGAAVHLPSAHGYLHRRPGAFESRVG